MKILKKIFNFSGSFVSFTSPLWHVYHSRKLIYSVYANTILQGFILILPPMCFCLIFFNCDPSYFLAEEFIFSCWTGYRENLINHDNDTLIITICRLIVQFFRFVVNTFYGLLLGGRFLAFVLLLDCCRIWTYDFCITAMTTITCPFTLHKVYSQLRVCHSVIGRFYGNIYCVFMGFCQILLVVDWWISFVAIGRIPFIVWIMFPLMAAEAAVGAFLYLRMAHAVHSMSESILLRPLQLQMKSKGNRLLSLMWKSVRPLDMRCGILFRIKSQSLLTSLHLVMNNFGTFIIINDFRRTLRVW